MMRLIRRWLERRRARNEREGQESFRYMVRTLIESNSPTIIVEKGGEE